MYADSVDINKGSQQNYTTILDTTLQVVDKKKTGKVNAM
jgi:hypothetical protein